MKLKKSSMLTAVVMSLWLTVAGLGCLVSSFELSDTEISSLILGIGIVSVFWTAWFRLVKKDWLLLPLFGLLALFLFWEKEILTSLEFLVWQISTIYDMAYGCGTVRWSTGSLRFVDGTMGLILVGTLISFAICYTLCRNQWSGIALIPSFLPLLACCVVTDTVPAASWVFWWITGVVVLIMTQNIRRKNQQDANRLTALLLIPVLLAGQLLFYLVPQDAYEEQIDSLTKEIMEWVDGLNILPNGNLFPSTQTSVSMDLSDVGPRKKDNRAVLTVVSNKTQMLYLRGQAYENYDGTSWSIDQERGEDKELWPSKNMIQVGVVSVTVRIHQNVKYFPYYPGGAGTDWQALFEGGAIPSSDGENNYSFAQWKPEDLGTHGVRHPSISEQERFTQLPESTLAEAKKILEQYDLLSATGIAQKAQKIRDYVQGVARYDLDTPSMPEGKDFAIWFLTESDSGYCTHYATAAVVLLRAAGISARLVSGYCVNVSASVPTIVTGDKAHAWVEYLDPSTGWTVLDATPSEWMGITDPTQPPTTKPTQPTETVTEPTETVTEPTETATKPTTTKPTGTVPTQTETTVPTEPGPGDPQTAKPLDLRWLWIPAILGAIWLQYALRKGFKKKQMTTGAPNRQAKYRWRAVLKLCRLMKLNPTDRLKELADKATFSQHQLSREELAEFDLWITEAKQILKKKLGIFRGIFYLIFAI